ncbi:MAG: hypothetical protein P9M13_01245 [Candidatus Ancaeobacter aquaticus]|nr:hypothetical protein [Candidatus Ancaeobacter aquaticus]
MRKLISLLILIVLVSSFLCSACHSESDDTLLKTFPPFTIIVEVLKDGGLVGVGKCEVRIGVSDGKDRIEIIEFIKGFGFENKSTDYVDVSSYLLEITEIKCSRPGFYSLICKDFDGTIYKGFVDFSEIRRNDHDTWNKYMIELRDISGKLIKNISDEGRRFKKKYIPKVGL